MIIDWLSLTFLALLIGGIVIDAINRYMNDWQGLRELLGLFCGVLWLMTGFSACVGAWMAVGVLGSIGCSFYLFLDATKGV